MINPTEEAQLREILADDYVALVAVGDEADGFETVSREDGDNRRWSKYVTLVTKSPSGVFIQWGYDEGLTEYGENEIDESQKFVEVKPVTRTIIVTEWAKV